MMRGTTRGRIAVWLSLTLSGACSSADDTTPPQDLKAALSATADRAVATLAAQAETVSASPPQKPLEDALGPFVDELKGAAHLFRSAAKETDADTNTFVYVGLNLALLEATRATELPASSAEGSDGGETLDDLFENARDEEVSDFNSDDLAEEVRRTLRPLAYVSLLGNDGFVRRFLPPGSSEAARFAAWVTYDDQGDPTVAIPPPGRGKGAEIAANSWNSFVKAVSGESEIGGSRFGQALERIDHHIERFNFRAEA